MASLPPRTINGGRASNARASNNTPHRTWVPAASCKLTRSGTPTPLHATYRERSTAGSVQTSTATHRQILRAFSRLASRLADGLEERFSHAAAAPLEAAPLSSLQELGLHFKALAPSAPDATAAPPQAFATASQDEQAKRRPMEEATSIAKTHAQLACMNKALRHTNTNLAQQLREEQRLRIELKLRIEKFKVAGIRCFDVSCDPVVERAAHMMVREEEVHAMSRQVSELRYEATLLRAELALHKKYSGV